MVVGVFTITSQTQPANYWTIGQCPSGRSNGAVIRLLGRRRSCQLTTNGARCRTCATVRNRRGIGGWDWSAIRAAILQRDDYRCVQCGDTTRLQVHHRLPLIDGGSNEPGNLGNALPALPCR